MITALHANLVTHLRFCGRNRLLLVFAVIYSVFSGLTLLPVMLFTSNTSRFEVVHRLYTSLSACVTVLLCLVALLSVWYHKNQKCVKLVFTKPCTPGAWVVSHYVTGLILYVTATVLIMGLVILLMLGWKLPWQWGIPVAVYYGLLHVAYFYSFLLMLSTLMHPILAVIVYFLLSDQLYFYLALLTRAGAEAVDGWFKTFCLGWLHNLCLGLYYVMPGGLDTGRLEKLLTSFRLTPGDWKYLLGETGYILLFCFLMYRITVYALDRQRHI